MNKLFIEKFIFKKKWSQFQFFIMLIISQKISKYSYYNLLMVLFLI